MRLHVLDALGAIETIDTMRTPDAHACRCAFGRHAVGAYVTWSSPLASRVEGFGVGVSGSGPGPGVACAGPGEARHNRGVGFGFGV